MTLPVDILNVAQVRQREAAAIAAGTPGYDLMQRAGSAAFAALRQRWPMARTVAVVAGPGNNGGDGLVLARVARAAGLDVDVQLLAEPSRFHGEAAQAWRDLQAAGIVVRPLDAARMAQADVIVDALLGVGVRAPLRTEWVGAIAAINASGRPVLAMDLPSGLDPDLGMPLPAVRAVATITFIALKQGLFVGEGPEQAGEVLFDSLQAVPAPDTEAALLRMTLADLAGALPSRPRQSHKGQFGTVLVVGGGTGMPGAVRLAAESALRVGAGLVRVASLPEHLAAVVGPRPELMFVGVQDAADLQQAMNDADVIAVGPGLGRDAWAGQMLATVLAGVRSGQQLVVDADALNLIAASAAAPCRSDWILTPHPGEAARLLGCTITEVQQDRPGALRHLCERYGGTVVLKGAATLVGTEGEIPRLCDRGNPGMSVPGMGDVLTGAVAGILAQSRSPFTAACAAVYAHAVAGDHCVRGGVRGVLALEVAHALRGVLAHPG